MSAELEALVSKLRTTRGPTDPTVEELRSGWEKIASALPIPDDIKFRDEALSSVSGEWACWAGCASSPFVLYFHGGGYNIGSVASYRQFVGRLSKACECEVLSVEYRLAPENRFPAAVEDALAAYRALLGNGHSPKD